MSFYSRQSLVLLFCCLHFFSSVAQNADIDLLRSINLSRNTSLDGTMKVVSSTEKVIGFGLPVALVAASYVRHDKVLFQKGFNMCLALAASSVHTYALKYLVNRERPAYRYPDIQALTSERYHSFPSGHTSNAFCTATSLSLNFKKWYVVLPSFAWAATVGYSRMHLGVHYPSDVLAGALLGAGSAYATYKVNKWLKKYYKQKYQAAESD